MKSKFEEKLDTLLENESADRERALVDNAIQTTKEEIAHQIEHYVTTFNYWKAHKNEVPDAIAHLSNITHSILTALLQSGVPIDHNINN
jgi:hypothetical protein